jgi:hypothetical protein
VRGLGWSPPRDPLAPLSCAEEEEEEEEEEEGVARII